MTLFGSRKLQSKPQPFFRRLVTRRGFGVSISVALLVTQLAVPAAAAQRLTYTALGDSLAFGAFAPLLRGYVPLYRNLLRGDTGASVNLINLGIPGWDSGDLRNALRRNPLFRLSLARAKVVTINIGGNDLRAARNTYKARACGGADNQDCLRSAVVTFKANWDAILMLVRSFNRGGSVIRTMDIYNPYVNEDKAADTWADDGGLNDFQTLKRYLEEVNDYIALTAAAASIPAARVYLAFNGPLGDVDPGDKGYLAFDGLHPDGEGHRVIADLLRGLGYEPLRAVFSF